MKAKNILDLSLDLIGLRNTDGTVPASCDDLKQRAPALLTILATDYKGIDSRATGKKTKIQTISSLEDDVALSTELCTTVIAYLLSALLIEDEDQALAATFRHIAENALTRFGHSKAKVHEIKEVY